MFIITTVLDTVKYWYCKIFHPFFYTTNVATITYPLNPAPQYSIKHATHPHHFTPSKFLIDENIRAKYWRMAQTPFQLPKPHKFNIIEEHEEKIDV